jgi:hypothetical protein
MPRGAPLRAAVVASALAAALAAPSCSSTSSAPRDAVLVSAPDWVTRASAGWDGAAEPCVVFATGFGRLSGDVARAEKTARDQAQQQLTVFVGQVLARLDAAFTERAAGVMTAADLAADVGDPGLHRSLVEGARDAARVNGKWQDDDNLYVWLRLDADAGLLQPYEKALSQRLAAQARELTDGDRERLRAALAAAVAERNAGR